MALKQPTDARLAGELKALSFNPCQVGGRVVGPDVVESDLGQNHTTVQILVIVAIIQMRRLKAEAAKGSMRTSIGHG